MEKGSKDEAEKGALDIIVQVFGVSFFLVCEFSNSFKVSFISIVSQNEWKLLELKHAYMTIQSISFTEMSP